MSDATERPMAALIDEAVQEITGCTDICDSVCADIRASTKQQLTALVAEAVRRTADAMFHAMLDKTDQTPSDIVAAVMGGASPAPDAGEKR